MGAAENKLLFIFLVLQTHSTVSDFCFPEVCFFISVNWMLVSYTSLVLVANYGNSDVILQSPPACLMVLGCLHLILLRTFKNLASKHQEKVCC